MKLKAFCFAILLGTLPVCAQKTGPLVLHTLPDYQVTALSTNGKWACGTYIDAANQFYAFRWDIENNKTILLSSGDCFSEANAVSNDGIVVGSFDNKEATSNGAPAYTAGYWKDGSWHHLPNINNAPVSSNEEVGYAYAISQNGRYIAGAYNDKESVCIPIIWEDGKVAHTFGGTGYDGMIYTVSEDGQRAAGWSITKNSESARVATLWEVGKGDSLLMDERLSDAWCSGRKFSPNGKYLLYWESFYDIPADQITDPNSSNMGLLALYNLETGEKTGMPTITRDPYNFDIFDITDNGTIVGYEQLDGTYVERAIIFKDGKTRYLEEYLEEKGVNIDEQEVIMPLDEASRHLRRGQGISSDENTFAVLYYDTIGATRTMVVKLNENLTSRPPVQLEATGLKDVGATRLQWKKPLAGMDEVVGYNVYRNGVKINSTPIGETAYWDTNLTVGTYSYSVTAVYPEGESTASSPIELTLPSRETSAPRSLFARQKGLDDVLLMWQTPQSNLAVKGYYPEEASVIGFGGGNNSFEVAIRFDAAEMALYKDHLLHSVSFYPMSAQQQWTINIYKKAIGTESTELIYTQPVTQTLQYGVQNSVKLNEAIELPTNADLYIAIAVNVSQTETSYNVIGEINGEARPGYSDLLRLLEEKDFYSLYDDAQKNSYEVYSSWAINAILATPQELKDNPDAISRYEIYNGEAKLGETNELTYIAHELPQGVHTLAVKAIYSDGRISPATSTTIDVTANELVYKAINTPRIALTDTHSIIAQWDVPVDDDETHITYAEGETQGGVVGPTDSNYGYMAAAIYGQEKLKGYDGYQIKAFRFYPLANAEFTFFLYAGEENVSTLFVEEYVLNTWNTVYLDEPITLKSGIDYRLALDCYDVVPGTAPLGLDRQMPFTGISDIYSLNEGASYSSINQASMYGNWMIGMVITSVEKNELPILGYDVRIDAKKVNETLLTTPSFTYQFPSDAKTAHRMNVDVHYEVKGKVDGGASFFTIGPDKIDEQAVLHLTLTQEQGFVLVEGEKIQSLTLYDLSGQLLVSAQGNKLDISGLPSGIYPLQIVVNNQVKSIKLKIKKML